MSYLYQQIFMSNVGAKKKMHENATFIAFIKVIFMCNAYTVYYYGIQYILCILCHLYNTDKLLITVSVMRKYYF